MEDFISEIYNDAFIIEQLKEFVFLINSGRIIRARTIYNDVAKSLESFLLKLSKTDPAKAGHIQDIAIKIKECYDDSCHATGIIYGQLIPELYSCIKNYTSIRVSEGDYSLVSSDTAFLTLYDNKNKIYFHDTYDPVWEGHRIAQSIYDPSNENFLIFGCGLGYLAYNIYKRSEGSTKIYIFEDDKTVIDYAYLYGLLSLIPEECIEIICDPVPEVIGSSFLDHFNTLNSVSFYFAPWKKNKYDKICNNELNKMIINRALELETTDQSIINHKMNRLLSSIEFKEVKNRFSYNEWIVISAGPSLDDDISYVRESKGKKGLIAVNTVLRRLVKEGIYPDIIVAADQSNDLQNHIKGVEENTRDIIMVADRLLNWKYSYLYKGDICFVRTNAGGSIDLKDNEGIPVWDISGTVACLGIEVAVNLNAKAVYLVGQDLAYPSGRNYAKGIPHPDAKDAVFDIQVPSVNGGMVDTCDAFIWFRKAIEYQIRKYSNVRFINMSKHGAHIEGTTLSTR